MELNSVQIPQAILDICQQFNSNGFQAFIVGGSVRDLIRGELRPSDWDIATDARPEEVIQTFKDHRVIPTGIQHGTVTLLKDELSIEITTFRVEGKYVDGRRPTSVQFVSNIIDDLSRRDLTINAIAYDPITNNLVDPFKGKQDIQNQIIRLVGNPSERLTEDGLRLIRIFRFVSQLGYAVDDVTLKTVPKCLEVFDKVARERIQVELQKLFSGLFWKEAIKLLFQCKLVNHLVPTFRQKNMQNLVPNAELNRINLTLTILEHLSDNSSPSLRFAVFFHQLLSEESEDERVFPKYDPLYLTKVLKTLKFPNRQLNEILHIISISYYPPPYSLDLEDENTRATFLRIFLYKINPSSLEDYIHFMEAIASSKVNKSIISEELSEDLKIRSKTVKPIYLNDLKVNGNDIVTQLGINKNKIAQREFIGISLNILRECVEQEPSLNSKQLLLEILQRLKQILNLCTSSKYSRVSIISTDYIRKVYRNNNPEYSSWENVHTYTLAQWLVRCSLIRRKNAIVIFDATNLDLPSHPSHRKNLFKKFIKFKPIFINMFASQEEIKSNISSRDNEPQSMRKSDANLSIFHRYQNLMEQFPESLGKPMDAKIVSLSSRSQSFETNIDKLANDIISSGHKVIIMGGNVLTGKTYTAIKLKSILENILNTD
ncbi:MAG: CCA tRNA nucleotidyltransferase [Candidatus Hodarchaeales archaeon]|jgi:tRNA nucleotidyltransferase/poly(A) polymerase